MPDDILNYKFFSGYQPNNEVAIGIMGSEPNEKLVFCIPAQPVDQEDEDFDVGYHEDVVKTILAECGYDARAINEAEALCYAELENYPKTIEKFKMILNDENNPESY